MNAKRIEFSSRARADYISAYLWYLERSPESAARFAAEAQATLRRIVEYHATVAESPGGIRWMRMRKFPHLFYFRVGELIDVLTIRHGSQRPETWED